MAENTNCRCEGLGLVRDMILLYTEIAKGGVTSRATPEQKKEAIDTLRLKGQRLFGVV